MSEGVSYPEQYSLKGRDGSTYRLLVNTDTDRWHFRIMCGEVSVGESSCVQDGGELVVQHFQIQQRVPMRGGWLKGFGRMFSGKPPPLENFQGLGLGTALLHFIRQRARDFGVTEMLIDFKPLGLESGAPVVQWFERRGFELERSEHGSPTGAARLVLVPESGEVPPPALQITTGNAQPKPPKIKQAKKLPVRPTKGRVTPRLQKTKSAGFTKESLEKTFRPISDLINGKLPDNDGLLDPAVFGLLRASRAVVPHSGDTRVLQFHIKALAQPSIFHPHHFKYAVQYDPFGTKGGTATKNFCIEFYMSKIRIYHEREEMVKRVRRELSRLRLPGFEFRESERAFCYDHKFRAETEAQLINEVRKHLFPLLNAVHPTFYRIMDAFSVTMTTEDRRAVISGRVRINTVNRQSPNFGRNMEYRREVSPSLRRATFQRDSHRCQHCEKVFPVRELHADHVTPIARGGLTVLGNLQTLCGPCNLRKGKRLEAEL